MVLRPWEAEDVAAVVAAYADPDVARWHVRSMRSSEATEWIRAGEAAWREERAASRAIRAAGAVWAG